MERSRVAAVIPTLNESNTIKDIVCSVKKFACPIVVDDGSIDQSGSIAKEAGAIVVTHENNLGYDQAINSGFSHANSLGFKIVLTLDGDGQHNPELIREFIKVIDDGFDLVLGVRNYQQRFAEYLFSIFTKSRYGISDPLCGIKAYKIEIYQHLGHFDSYNSFGTELSFFAIKNGYKFKELPFSLRRRKDGSRFNQALRTNVNILKAMLKSVNRIKVIPKHEIL